MRTSSDSSVCRGHATTTAPMIMSSLGGKATRHLLRLDKVLDAHQSEDAVEGVEVDIEWMMPIQNMTILVVH